MNSVLRTFRTWSNSFFASEETPLLWMFLGPFLIILTLGLAPASHSALFLPLMTAVGLIASWKYRGSGYGFALLAFVLYLGVCSVLDSTCFSLWNIAKGLSLILGLTVSFLAMEEGRKFASEKKEEHEQTLAKLRTSIHHLEEKSASDIRLFEREQESLQEELGKAKEEITKLLGLVEGSSIETEKMFKQYQTLSEKSLEDHREKTTLQVSLRERERVLDELQTAHKKLQTDEKEHLDHLNNYRVELYQTKNLLESYIKKSEEKKGEAQKVEVKPAERSKDALARTQHLILQALEKDKSKIKSAYETVLSEYKELKSSDADSEQTLAKKQKLEQTKSELMAIEREIFVHRKKMQEQGAPVKT